MKKSTVKVKAEMKEAYKTEITASQNFIIDQPKSAGGDGLGPNPLEIFLSSLPACICAIGRIIAQQKNINLKGISVDAEGDIDKRFLAGLTNEGRAGFTEIRCKVDIDADLNEQEKQDYLEEITRRCPIADNIINASLIKKDII